MNDRPNARQFAYWMTPIDTLHPFVLGADRMRCEPVEKLELFRGELKQIHPRLLMMFKSDSLPGDPNPSVEAADSADRCGMQRVPFALANLGEIRFDGPVFGLSSCAEALTERLLDPAEATVLLRALTAADGTEAALWLSAMRMWLEQGKPVILIREET